MRLDQIVARNEGISRTKAKELIDDGNVLVNGLVSTKASLDVSLEDEISINNNLKYVGRGGYKLLKAIQEFRIDFSNKVVADVGSSTGGFTDCALQNGASFVYAIDVGHDQLSEKLRFDERVSVMEDTNIKDVVSLPKKVDYFVMDVSFVSIKDILKDIKRLGTIDSLLISLIKPQFEVGKGNTKKGIVKDKKLHIKVLQEITMAASILNLGLRKLTFSPITGKNGNIEYLGLFSFKEKSLYFDYKKIVDDAFSNL